MDISVKCPVYPTEDIERVKKTIGTCLGEVPLEVLEHGQSLQLISSKLTKKNLLVIRQLIHEKRILDVVRVRLLKNFNDLSITTQLHLDKQAAFVGRIRLIDTNEETPPLGSIEIQIQFENISKFEEFLNWFSPKTKDGRVII